MLQTTKCIRNHFQNYDLEKGEEGRLAKIRFCQCFRSISNLRLIFRKTLILVLLVFEKTHSAVKTVLCEIFQSLR